MDKNIGIRFWSARCTSFWDFTQLLDFAIAHRPTAEVTGRCMRKFLLIAILATSACATPIPITGDFEFGSNADYIDILGSELAWQFHQGDFQVTRSCASVSDCEISFSREPDRSKIIGQDGFAAVQNGSDYAIMESRPPFGHGSVYGTVLFQLLQTDLSGLPYGEQGPSVPAMVSGRIGATTEAGVVFMDDVVKAVGTLSTIAEKSQENSIIFLGALGTFKGTVEPVPEPAAWLLGTAGVLVLAVFRHRARRA